jgi:hypothetical protein
MPDNISKRLLLLGLIVFASAMGLMAQSHFTFTSNTGNNETPLLKVSSNPTINGSPMVAGDEVGAFTPGGLCVGANVWNGTDNITIPVWGDDDQTPAVVDGILPGETIQWRVWDHVRDKEGPAAVTYTTGNGIYQPDVFPIMGSFAGTVAPDAPDLSSPANGATGESVNPTLSWSASSAAASYRLQISTASDFSATVFDQTGITSTSQAVSPALSNNILYFWHVSATNAAGTSSYSTAFSFTTIIAPPTLSSPSNGAAGTAVNPTMSWTAPSGASSYRLQVSTISNFGTTVFDQSSITATSQIVTPALANNVMYFWRVDAANAGGTSGYSGVWSFTTIVATPAAPTLSVPTDGAAGTSVNPTLSWSSAPASEGTDLYQVQISTSSAFGSTAYDQTGLTATSQAVTPALTNNVLYFWHVRASNTAGTSAYSGVRSFTTIVSAP